MTATYHPNDNLLTEYAAGSLDLGLAIGVAAHLHFCAHCRSQLHPLNALGGFFLEDCESAPVDEQVLSDLLSRLDERPPQVQPQPQQRFELPQVVEKLVPDAAQLRWQWLAPALKVAPLTTGQTRYEVALHKISRGGKVGRHDHRGSEVTVVLRGSFSDDDGVYTEGDFLLREPGEVHRPTASQHEDCLCLSVVAAPVRLTGWLGRCLNPFLGFRPA